ncbi:hypothetical protein ABEF92_008111 [Exophiala dermatitidis]|uniref:CENP-V/GFA domain-containing protein n=1 Tax=Exophiala dermatitidis (strain ATCC 34100 / CBS 525.76 / NIH/UT8656) TaxID=858893 RepID=H6BS07_EXODN|nr:uncharacterized protein HMPREF1120_02239 [Exophiala dermatitidis NIH/UT8656]EHY54062.1 hypothetical protein HMPREF1120_02239 [Exophiala dermatitidis NIH/UT8656]
MKLSPPVEDGPVTNCNCSICHINGALMVYPLESNITWESGFDEMKTYTFGQKRIAHTFCPTCGTSISGKSTDPNFFAHNRAINVSQPHELLCHFSYFTGPPGSIHVA